MGKPQCPTPFCCRHFVVATLEIREAKKGDLSGVFVYKFKCVGQPALLAYEYDPATRLLLLLGSHENFYRELKR